MADLSLASDPHTLAEDRRAKRNVLVLIVAQAVLGAQMPMVFTIGGLAGGMLAPNPCFATLPISLIVFGSMTTAPWLSMVMQRYGRTAGFIIGALGGMVGALTAAAGLWYGSFWLLLLGSYFTGIYMSAQGFYRFAAIDTASPAYRPKAISFVMAGGLAAAVIGPPLGTGLAQSFVIPFVGSYLGIAALNALFMGIFFWLDIPKPPKPSHSTAGRSRRELLRDPTIAVAIICAMVSYALMNLVMTSTPLAVVACGFPTETAGWVVSSHVVAMFLPSFFTGHIIARYGAVPVVWSGLAILAGAGVIALMGVELGHFYGALILLGVGWNFGFIGATSLLAEAHSPEERGRAQGLNDTIVFGCVTIASLASGGLLNCSGGDVIQGWTAVNLAMVPFLALAGAALLWLQLRPSEAPTAR